MFIEVRKFLNIVVNGTGEKSDNCIPLSGIKSSTDSMKKKENSSRDVKEYRFMNKYR